MSHTPEQQWSALSALYEEADALPAPALAAWLARLEAARHPLVPQLRRMLEARAHLETDDFLGTLPKLSAVDANQASDWAPGDRVGPYRLVRPLGEGGMAEVWLADRDDGVFKRQVAIKLPYPRPGRESFATRFDRERNILASLRHPHIAGLFDAGVTKEGQAWLALEYVEGQSISKFCDERRLPLRERVMLFRQVLLAVQHAHANLVIHRDLKPANILVTPQGEVRLLDFGIAKLLEAEGDAIAETELTRQAGRSMTPRYASPEQLTGLPLTTACDVYSLGVVFYELMCGERPYELKTESPAQLEHAILEVEVRAPSRRHLSGAAAEARGTSAKALRRALSPELDAITLRCLAKKPSSRYASVDGVLADIDRWLAGEAVLARAPTAWYRFGKFAVRHRLAVGMAAAAVLSLAAVAATAVVLGLQAREESARAIAARDFMLSLFKRADQEKSRGADITARELLESGRKDLLTQLASQPRLQAELLLGIATIQNEMGEYLNADSTFADAARIYSSIGLNREASFALASYADNALQMGNPKRAQTLLEEAKARAERRPGDSELNARLAEVEGWITIMQGDPAHARDLFVDSRRHAVQAFGAHHARTMDALRGLIQAEQMLRNFDRALELHGQLEAFVAAARPANPKEVAATDRDRALLLRAAGRFADESIHDKAALGRCVVSLGPNAEDCRRLVLIKMNASLRLGFLDDAREALPFVEALADDASSPRMQADALLLLLRLRSALGTPASGSNLAERVRTLGQASGDASLDPINRAKALLVLAESRLREGDPAEAQRWIEQALALQRPGDRSTPARQMGAVGKSLMGVALLQRGEADKAVVWMHEAQEIFSQVMGPEHALTQLFSLNVALCLEAQGHVPAALSLVQSAEPVLQRAFSADSPAYLHIKALLRRLQSANAREATAALSPARAPIDPRSHRGTTSNVEFFS